MSTQTLYDALTESQQLLLGYAAYKGTAIGTTSLEQFAQVFHIENPGGDMDVLKEKGLYDACWGLVDKYFLEVVGWVYDNHQQWPSSFERKGFRHDETMHRLWLSYYSAESGVVDTITLNRRYKDMLAPLMKKERYYHILDQLSGRDFGSVMADALRADLLNDNLTEEALENYLDNVKCFQTKQKSRLQNYGQLVDEIGFWAHLHFSVGGYPKIVLSRYMKNGRFDTPLS